MSDLDVLQELIYEGALIPLMETPYGGKIVVLGESDSQGGIQYSIKIKGIPDDSVVVKTDMFPSPRGIFSCQRGECKRADYVIVTNSETDNFIVHVEMKKGEGNASEIINQLKGSECFIAYCRAIVCRFWQQSRFLDRYESRFVTFRRIGTRKSRTRESYPSVPNDIPERMFRISTVKDGGEVHFSKLIRGGHH